MMDLDGSDMGHGSYGITQGNVGPSGRKRGKSRKTGEGGKRKKAAAAAAAASGMEDSHIHAALSGGYAHHDYSVENPTVSSTQPGPSMHQGHQGRAPKMAFKKANRDRKSTRLNSSH